MLGALTFDFKAFHSPSLSLPLSFSLILFPFLSSNHLTESNHKSFQIVGFWGTEVFPFSTYQTAPNLVYVSRWLVLSGFVNGITFEVKKRSILTNDFWFMSNLKHNKKKKMKAKINQSHSYKCGFPHQATKNCWRTWRRKYLVRIIHHVVSIHFAKIAFLNTHASPQRDNQSN